MLAEASSPVQRAWSPMSCRAATITLKPRSTTRKRLVPTDVSVLRVLHLQTMSAARVDKRHATIPISTRNNVRIIPAVMPSAIAGRSRFYWSEGMVRRILPRTELVLLHFAKLGLRPLERVPFVTELTSGRPPVKLPIDSYPAAIHSAVPGSDFTTQSFQIGDSSVAEALS